MTAETTGTSSSLDAVETTDIDSVAKSIWQLTEDVLELLRSRSTRAVHQQKKPDLLWLDDLTETQGNMVITVRRLCDVRPEGVTLRTLAETVGVTPAAASVMVDLLVKKKVLKRSKSKSDRRAILIRLTPDTAALFDISERTLRETFHILEAKLGREALLDWQGMLLRVASTLRELVAAEHIIDEPESEASAEAASG